jgi:hypothetical protein
MYFKFDFEFKKNKGEDRSLYIKLKFIIYIKHLLFTYAL